MGENDYRQESTKLQDKPVLVLNAKDVQNRGICTDMGDKSKVRLWHNHKHEGNLCNNNTSSKERSKA